MSPAAPPLPAPLPPSPYGRLFTEGQPWVWVTRLTTAVLLLMVAAIVALVLWNGLPTFWPRRLVRYAMADGHVVVGQEIRRAVHRVGADSHPQEEIQVRVGNRDVVGSGEDFRWIAAKDVAATSEPEDLLEFERVEHGPAFGRVREVLEDGNVVATGERALAALRAGMESALRRREETERALRGGDAARAAGLRVEDRRHQVLLEDGAGTAFPAAHPISGILRVDEVNRLGFLSRVGLFLARWWRFVSEEPREANTDGGIWPAIFGTMLMTLVMSLLVVPFGVLAALYLREYARQGWAVSAVRIAVNNLAGVPSIVFGVFGLGFFCITVGGFIDRTWFADALPSPTFGGGGILWASLTLALLTVPVVIVATEEAFAAVPKGLREASYACGASKWQTMRRVVLPYASPGILTGAILAMARGAGEVAPLMLTGVVKLAKDLPVDGEAPYLHPERKFMHLGFHVYDTGFQSPNVDASTPLVYSTTLVLLALVLALNLGATILRNRLRKRFRTGVFG